MKKKLLIQSDDFGMTYGITDGTIRAIKDGIIKNTGLFVNMESSEYAANRAKNLDVCLGIDINLCSGKPVSELELVRSLVTSSGEFKSSRQILKENPNYTTDKYLYHFEVDPYDYGEVLVETENQVKRFIELMGKLPEYINSHSVLTPNTEKAARVVAEKYGILKSSSQLYFDDSYCDLTYQGEYVELDLVSQINEDYTSAFIRDILPKMTDEKCAYFIFHCGYIDKTIFSESSLTIQRMNDTACASDPRIIEYIKKNDIELITYRDL